MPHSYQGLTRRVPHWDGTADPGAAYAQWLADNYAYEVFRLTDVVSGTVPAVVSSARNGTQTGWTVQDGGSPVAGETLQAPFIDGLNDYGNLYSASLASLVSDASEIGLFCWARVYNASVWTDATSRFVVNANSGGAPEELQFRKGIPDEDFRYDCGADVHIETISTTDWFSLALCQSATAGNTLAYENGSAVDTMTYGGGWASALLEYLVGASSTTPTAVWHGWLAYIAVGPPWNATQVSEMHAGVSG